MLKVKKFIILPVGLLALNYFLGFYRDPWRIFFWQTLIQKKVFFLFRNLLGCAAYIFLIAFLFVYVFTNENLKVLLKKSTLKILGIVFAVELILRLILNVLDKMMQDRYFLEAAKHGVKPPEWYSTSIILSLSIIHFVVLYLTLQLLIKSLNLGFVFRKWAFFDMAVFYLAVSYLNNHIILSLFDYLEKSKSFTLTTVTVSGRTMSLDTFNILTQGGQELVILFLDLLIFEYINRCIKDRTKPAPVENTNQSKPPAKPEA